MAEREEGADRELAAIISEVILTIAHHSNINITSSYLPKSIYTVALVATLVFQ